MIKYMLTIFLMFLVGCATSPNPKEMIFIGFVQEGCSNIINKNSIITMPATFNIKPTEAAQLIQKKYNEQCLYKFGYVIYADTLNYYILRRPLTLFGSEDIADIKNHSYIINGKTGDVSKN